MSRNDNDHDLSGQTALDAALGKARAARRAELAGAAREATRSREFALQMFAGTGTGTAYGGSDSGSDDTSPSDAASNATTSDGASSDAATSDGASSDAATSDGASSDAATSDGASSDAATSDGASSDAATSDGASSDAATSDGASSDAATSDGASSDAPSSDETSSDAASSDATSSDAASSDATSSDAGSSSDSDSAFGGEAVTPERRQTVAQAVTFDPGVSSSDLTDANKTSAEIVRTIDQITSTAPGGLGRDINISALNTDHHKDTVHTGGMAFDVNKVGDVHVGADQATKDFVKDVINNCGDVTAIGSVKEVINDPDVKKAAETKGVTLRLDEPKKADGTRVFHVHVEAKPD